MNLSMVVELDLTSEMEVLHMQFDRLKIERDLSNNLENASFSGLISSWTALCFHGQIGHSLLSVGRAPRSRFFNVLIQR